MALVSVTRVKLRSVRFLPAFFWMVNRSERQARHAAGNLASVLRRSGGSYWTLTLWQDKAAMRTLMLEGAHRSAMARAATWFEEAAVVYWEQDSFTPPDWAEAERRMGVEGWVSPVTYPTAAQACGAPLGEA